VETCPHREVWVRRAVSGSPEVPRRRSPGLCGGGRPSFCGLGSSDVEGVERVHRCRIGAFRCGPSFLSRRAELYAGLTREL
jgi:hypothetical protein